jgi:5-methylcytosine-specific restriction enzyme A
LKGKIQDSMKLTGELREYIMSFFEDDLTEGYYPDEVSEILEEGNVKPLVSMYMNTILLRVSNVWIIMGSNVKFVI